jgi:glycosyltransferase involved in cell wall biosynthesis
MSDLAVIMSVYRKDKLKYVCESIQSILKQTYTDFDYYIVLDGPVKPEIYNYISTIGDRRIKLFRRDENEGIAVALNYLLTIILSNPGYAFIARMDADDISCISRLLIQRVFLLNNPDISCLGCWYQEIDEYGKILRNIKLPAEHEIIKKRYFTRTPFAHPSVLFRRELIEQAGFYPTDTVLMEDNVLWGNALKSGLRFANIPEYLFKFRIDRDFYKRRSGLKYGWNYIKTKFRINHNLGLPFYYYIVSIAYGTIKMLPSFIIKLIYSARTLEIFTKNTASRLL